MTALLALAAAGPAIKAWGYALSLAGIVAATSVADEIGGLAADIGPSAGVVAAIIVFHRITRSAYRDAADTHQAERQQLLEENARLRARLRDYES